MGRHWRSRTTMGTDNGWTWFIIVGLVAVAFLVWVLL